jgi:hypothetical protein
MPVGGTASGERWEFCGRTEDEVVHEIGNDDLQFCLLDRVEAED